MSNKDEYKDDELKENDFKLEDILSEFRYDATVSKTRKPVSVSESVDVDITDNATAANQKLTQLLDDMRRLTEQETAPLPRTITTPDVMPLENPLKPEPPVKAKPDDDPVGEIVIDQSLFGPPEDFSAIFAPSDTYVGSHEDDHLESEAEPVKKTFVERIAERSKKIKEPDISPAEAAAKLEPYVRSLTFRAMIAFVLCIPVIYGSVAHRMMLPFPKAIDFLYSPYMYLFYMLTGQILVMFCGIDVLSRGLAAIVRLKPTAESGVVITCLASMVHVFSIFMFGGTYIAYLPYCGVSASVMFFAVLAARLKYGARLRTYIVAKNANPSQVVTMEDRLWEDTAGITKRVGEPVGFVAQTEEPDNVERFSAFFMPLALISSLLLALLVSVGVGEPKKFFWAWSAIMSCVTPFSALFAFTLPFNVVSKRLASVGAAIAGWTGARLLSKSDVAVLTDSDVFPAGTVSLNGLKVFGSHSFDKVISYATSVVSASGSELSTAFAELLKGNTDAIRTVRDFEHFEGGGMGAYLGNDRVFVGSYNFMVSMSISMPQELNIKNAVFISINMELAGIFAINYTTPNGVKSSLHMLNRQGMLPLFAVRDFNITATSIKTRFKLTDEQLDYPVIEERLVLSDKNRVVRAKPAAVSGREGLLTYAECIVGGITMKKVSNANLILSAVCALVGLLLMFYFASADAASTASPVNVLMFQLLWCVPTVLISGWAGRY